MKNSYTIYWAGDLFDFKDLCGNVALALAIEEASEGKFLPRLPQDSESNSQRSTDIRDRDLELLFSCDLAVFNFDGTDLDSGTVLEFAYAKMLDIPTALLRSDFRNGGDQTAGTDPWNLMCSGYPRSESVLISGMNLYHQLRSDATHRELPALMCRHIAAKVIDALKRQCAAPSLFGGDAARAVGIYRWAAESCGPTFRKIMTDGKIDEIIDRKKRAGLL